MTKTSRRWWRPLVGALAVMAWLTIADIGGPLTGQLSSLQDNNQSSFLPDGAESTAVSIEIERFGQDDILPMLVVLGGDGELSTDQLDAARALAERLPREPLGIGSLRVGDFLVGDSIPVIPSADSEAVLLSLSLDAQAARQASGEDSVIAAIADVARTTMAQEVPAEPAYVTGPAGFIVDISAAFAGIDGLLLIVALVVVLVILVAVYRSPVLPITVLVTSVFGLALAGLLVYAVAEPGYVTVTGQSQGILSILVVGAATDYALLVVARYKEELARTPDAPHALWRAYRATLPPIAASASTVILGLLALLLADLKGTSGLGPVAAIGILGAVAASITLLPAFLYFGRRWIFWPAIPRYDAAAAAADHQRLLAGDGADDGDTSPRGCGKELRHWCRALPGASGLSPRRGWPHAHSRCRYCPHRASRSPKRSVCRSTR